MAYIKTSIAQITKLDADYKIAKDALDGGNLAQKDQKKFTKQMAEIPGQAAQRLMNAIEITQDQFDEHKTNTTRWLSEAESLLKNAKAAAVAYKKKPADQTNATYVNNFAGEIATRKNSYDRDSHDFGEAWSDVRAFNATNLPREAMEEFTTARAKIIGDQPALLAMGHKIGEAAKQAEALKAIIAKASMKKDIKAGGEQRNIGVARTQAKAVADELAEARRLLETPASMSVQKPASIKTGAQQLTGVAGMKDYPATKKDWVIALGFWQTVEQAQKQLLAGTASMEKVLATRTRGFRSNELSDAQVKSELAKAATSVKEAKTLIKTYAGDFANAKKAHATILAKAKKKKFA